MAKPLAVGSFVANGLLITLLIISAFWIYKLKNHEGHEGKSNETVSTQFSLKAELSLKKLEFNKSCLILTEDYIFINTETNVDNSSTFEVNTVDKCIKQKDFLDTGKHNLNLNVKKKDTNETIKLMVTFDVAAAAEKSVFKMNEFLFVEGKEESVKLEVDDFYSGFKFNISDNSKVQAKLDTLNETNRIITLDRNDLNNASLLNVIANKNDNFKRATIKVCYLTNKSLPIIKETNLKYNKSENANKIFVKAVTDISCKIDTTYSVKNDDVSLPYKVKTNGEITVVDGKTAETKTFEITLKTVAAENTQNVTITVV